MILVGSTIALTGVYLGGMYANLNSEFVRNHHRELIVSHTTLILGCFGYLIKLIRRESRDNQQQELSGPRITAELVHVHPNALPAETDISTERLMPVTVNSLFSPLQKEVSRE